MDLTTALAAQLAKRSSRRGFFRLVGASALGSGLALTGTEYHSRPTVAVALAAAEGHVGPATRLTRRATRSVVSAGTDAMAVGVHRTVPRAASGGAATDQAVVSAVPSAIVRTAAATASLRRRRSAVVRAPVPASG